MTTQIAPPKRRTRTRGQEHRRRREMCLNEIYKNKNNKNEKRSPKKKTRKMMMENKDDAMVTFVRSNGSLMLMLCSARRNDFHYILAVLFWCYKFRMFSFHSFIVCLLKTKRKTTETTAKTMMMKEKKEGLCRCRCRCHFILRIIHSQCVFSALRVFFPLSFSVFVSVYGVYAMQTKMK